MLEHVLGIVSGHVELRGVVEVVLFSLCVCGCCCLVLDCTHVLLQQHLRRFCASMQQVALVLLMPLGMLHANPLRASLPGPGCNYLSWHSFLLLFSVFGQDSISAFGHDSIYSLSGAMQKP